MGNLIIVVISVVLVAVISAAGFFYGGDIFTNQAARTAAVALSNQFAQLNGAAELYKLDHGGELPATPLVLVTEGYLSSPIAPPHFGIYRRAEHVAHQCGYRGHAALQYEP
jgi:hypothetical protein